MFARIALLALALCSLLPAPAAAQTFQFPAGDGQITGYPLSVIDWHGKPAILCLGPWTTAPTRSGSWMFVEFRWPKTVPPVSSLSLTLVAAYAQDTRPCAQGNLPLYPRAVATVDNGDYMHVLTIGPISPAGWVYWEGSVFIGERNWPQWQDNWKPFILSYCGAWQTRCTGDCSGPTGGNPGPQFSAVVLTIN